MSAALTHRFSDGKLAVPLVLAAALGLPSLVVAQDAPMEKLRLGAGDHLGQAMSAAAGQPGETSPYVAVVTGDNVYVRCGADFRYYPFGRVHKGDVLKVIGEKSRWARVATLGSAFDDFFGYIMYPKTETGHFRLHADGKTGTTLGPTDLYAPNLDAGFDPNSSWKPVMKLAAERTVRVMETAETEGYLVHKIAVPADAEGWINVTLLRAATPVEAARWNSTVAENRPAAPSVKRTGDDNSLEVTVQPVLGRDSATPSPPVQRAKPTITATEPRHAKIVLEDLEAAYKRLLNEPIETAEVAPLRNLYLDLAERHRDNRLVAAYATARSRQLLLWSELQQNRTKLTRISAGALLTAEAAATARGTLDAADEYVAVGRLDASTIYDGERLPRLLRVRDPATGRTVAYVQPDAQGDLTSRLGQLIGIVGETSYDGGLRLTLVHPQRIDALATPP